MAPRSKGTREDTTAILGARFGRTAGAEMPSISLRTVYQALNDLQTA
jgi:hypothetical protein